jgi:small subunit ribosomal protein S11
MLKELKKTEGDINEVGLKPEIVADKKAEKSEAVSVDKKGKEGEKPSGEAKDKDKDAKDGEATAKKKKKKIRRQVLKGQVHVQCTYNNTIVTFADLSGKVLAWCSAGSLGFKGAKKATPYAATQIVNTSSEKVEKYGLKEIEVYVKGVGSGREASIRALANKDFEITLIKDLTPIPHNGCRPRKPRRV